MANSLKYISMPDYQRQIIVEGRVVDTFVHCGKCMSIKTDGHCRHCSRISQQKQERLSVFLSSKQKQKEENNYDDLI